MKSLSLPIDVDDEAVLKSIVRRNPLAECPHIVADTTTVLARYHAYINARGNPLDPIAPASISLLGDLGEAIPRKYEQRNSKSLAYISEIRENGSPHVCPMCGAPKPTTIDHVFPQTHFKDLAIFSPNLVPACAECNSGRQNNYKGSNPGERVLHPYFDKCLEGRLLRVSITPINGDYTAPNFDLEVMLPLHDPLYPTVNFHVEKVLKPAKILRGFSTLWVNLQRVPKLDRMKHVYFQMLPIPTFTDADFDSAVNVALGMSDEEFHTPNNWKSMLFAGLVNNVPAKAFLAQTIRRLRINPDAAADI